jgi:pyruvate,orthophosphate dikinase
MQDIEFTVQHGALYLLQSRTGKRAPAAAVRIAVDMCRDGLIDRDTALGRVTAEQAHLLLAPRLADGAADAATLLASGEAACPGVAIGRIVTTADEAETEAGAGHDVILMRPTTSPEDVHGMIAAKAVITETGGATSHAAVVSRALGKPCIVGCGADMLGALKGRIVTVDGASGRVFDGGLAMVAPNERSDPHLAQLSDWARMAAPQAKPGDGLPALLAAIHGIEIDQEAL